MLWKGIYVFHLYFFYVRIFSFFSFIEVRSGWRLLSRSIRKRASERSVDIVLTLSFCYFLYFMQTKKCMIDLVFVLF